MCDKKLQARQALTRDVFILAVIALLTGCASLGYSAEQYKAMKEGAIVCNYGMHVTGTVGGLALNAPELAKKMTGKSRITVKPGEQCATTFETEATGVEPVAPTAVVVPARVTP